MHGPGKQKSKKSILKSFAKFTEKTDLHTLLSLFFNENAGLWDRRFSVNSRKFLRTPFLQSNSGWLLLYLGKCPVWKSKSLYAILFLMQFQDYPKKILHVMRKWKCGLKHYKIRPWLPLLRMMKCFIY